MKNLKLDGIQEMNTIEMKEVNGGMGLTLLIALLVVGTLAALTHEGII